MVGVRNKLGLLHDGTELIVGMCDGSVGGSDGWSSLSLVFGVPTFWLVYWC